MAKVSRLHELYNNEVVPALEKELNIAISIKISIIANSFKSKSATILPLTFSMSDL